MLRGIRRQVLFVPICLAGVFSATSSAGESVDYVREIKPILAKKCFACHGALKQRSELRLDTARMMRRGGENGPAIVPGNAKESLLIGVVTGEADFSMPPKGEGQPLTPDEIDRIKAWINAGAKAPTDEKPAEDPRKHWSFQAIVRPDVPQVTRREWALNPIDAFVAAAHEQRKLTPVQAASKHVLLRRVYLDLIGLPPTRAELLAFLADDRQDAYEQVVDDLLARPQYGERWGRHWMDVWRYSDWYGRRQVNDVRNSYPHVWRWRDWIIRSLNEDKGYDQMIRQMLAADELDPTDDENIVALGFIVRNWFSLNYDQWKKDLVEHTGKAFLGIRLNCAHCHDHKYDPVTQEEYFKFRAFFEPLELRHDRVPGGGPLTKYKRYTPSSSGSLKPIAAGLARIFDVDLEAKTFMYKLGDARDRFDRPPVAPGVPAVLGGEPIKIERIELPPTAWRPGLKAFVEREETEKRSAAILAARRELEKLRKNPAGAAELKLKVAERKLAAAEADLSAVRARIDADKARYLEGKPNAEKLAKQASRAERQAAWAAAGARLTAAELSLSQAESKPASDKMRTKSIQAAQKTRAASRAAVAKAEQAAEQALKTESTKYKPFGPTYPQQSTGRRTALARWIASKKNPRTARVAVNHIWMRHFGRPLVESVFDFGRGGKEPSHPKLLDWLAIELIESGWSMKHLHRLIATSNAFRLSSASKSASKLAASRADVANESIDADNRYLWHFGRQRLEGEIIRDSILHVAGQLDQTLGGPEIAVGKEASSMRRSLYFAVYPEAGGMMRFISMFDAPDPCDCYRRRSSIVPQQALAMTNSRLILNASRVLARRLKRPADGDRENAVLSDEAFVRRAFEQVLTRQPSESELKLCRNFLRKQQKLFEKTASLNRTSIKGSVAPSSDPATRAKESLVRVLFSHNDFVTAP